MIPRVIFRHSWVYEARLQRQDLTKLRPLPPRALRERMRGYERVWRRRGPKIIRELARVTRLRWNEQEIVCYVTAAIRQHAFSDPLTLSPWEDATFFIDTLTHELIHRLLALGEPRRRLDRNWRRLMRKYRRYNQLVRTHIVVHSIHALALKKLSGENALKQEITSRSRHSAYALAWKVAKAEGYENIVRMLTARA